MKSPPPAHDLWRQVPGRHRALEPAGTTASRQFDQPVRPARALPDSSDRPPTATPRMTQLRNHPTVSGWQVSSGRHQPTLPPMVLRPIRRLRDYHPSPEDRPDSLSGNDLRTTRMDRWSVSSPRVVAGHTSPFYSAVSGSPWPPSADPAVPTTPRHAGRVVAHEREKLPGQPLPRSSQDRPRTGAIPTRRNGWVRCRPGPIPETGSMG